MTRRRDLLLAAPLLAGPGLARGQALQPFAIPVRQDDSVAPGFRRDTLLRWGDRVTFDAPDWAPNAPEPEAAAAQFGWDARICGIATPPLAADGVPRGVLAVAHPQVDGTMAWPGAGDRPAVAAAMQGASLINLEKQRGRWVTVDGGFQSRRLTARTLCRLSGPAAAEGGSAVIGLLGLRGGGVTPWGTLLLAEGDAEAWLQRLRPFEPAFLHGEGYGWVAELDPLDPQSVPVKRTALGRMAHGDVAAATSRDGRAVVYLTDRRPRGMLYRFVSAGPADGADALDEGTLFVAQLEAASGALRWLPLPAGTGTVRDVAAAGRAAGGTPLEDPSGVALDPRRPRLLLACRGGSARRFGNVLELIPAGEDHGAATATTSLLFAAGDPAGPGRYGGGGLPAGAAFPENPDTVTIDTRGRAWIGTNHGTEIRAQATGLFLCPLDGPRRGAPMAVYGAPRGAAVGGAALPPDAEIMLAAVRHPGAGWGQSFARPGTRWPQFQPGIPPRSALVGLAEG